MREIAIGLLFSLAVWGGLVMLLQWLTWVFD
jgi:hypothetical protein